MNMVYYIERCNGNYENCKMLQRQKKALLDSPRALRRTSNFTKIMKIMKTAKFCTDVRGR